MSQMIFDAEKISDSQS